MRQSELLLDETRLFEALCSIEALQAGFRRVKKNKGSPGVDGVTISTFESRLSEELSQLQAELASWTYKPSPVRRVEIPKPGGKGIRLLGVPTVRDRVVHAALKELLEPIFEPLFSDHSYGFRPQRNQRQAVEAAREIVAGGKPYVVDIDLSKFFDRIHHDRLIPHSPHWERYYRLAVKAFGFFCQERKAKADEVVSSYLVGLGRVAGGMYGQHTALDRKSVG